MLGSSKQRRLLSLNNNICLCEQRRRNSEPECFRRLEIDRQFELSGLLDRQITGRRAFEDPIDVYRRPSVQLDGVRPVRDEAAGFDVLAGAYHEREPVAGCELETSRLKRLVLTQDP